MNRREPGEVTRQYTPHTGRSLGSITGMSCEDTTTPTPARLSWLLEQYEPFSKVWICKAYGRATTTAAPADLARAVLAGHLAAYPPPHGETIRATARADGGTHATLATAQLPDDAWDVPDAVLQALPLYLRDALSSTPQPAG